MLLTVLSTWAIDPIPTVGIILTGVGYAAALRRFGRVTGRGYARGRVVCFALGLVALLVALDGPPDGLGEGSFAAHMAQHMLLQMVAAPLLLLGGPVSLLLRADPAWFRRRVLVSVLRSGIVRLLTHPVTTLPLFGAVLVGTHLTGFYELALQHEWVHSCEHLAYLVTALLVWWPAIGVDPAPHRMTYPARVLYLFLMMPVPALLGVAIANSPRVMYPWYLSHHTLWGASALSDQQAAGTLLWIAGAFTVVPALGVVVWRWLEQDERAQIRRDALSAARRPALNPAPHPADPA